MNRIIFLFFTVSIAVFPIRNIMGKQYGDTPQKIIVAGKIDNYGSGRDLEITVYRLGFGMDIIYAKTDNAGNFIATFESHIPLDAYIKYKDGFYLLLHPGDSLFVHFDGKTPALLESVRFGGNAAKINQDALKFQQMHRPYSINYDKAKYDKAVKEYNAEQYLQYLDTIQKKGKEIYDRFVAENDPDNVSKKWALLHIENECYREIQMYDYYHKASNKMGHDAPSVVPKGFYDVLCNRLPLDATMFINASGLFGFHNGFYRYVIDKLKYRETGGIVGAGKIDNQTISSYIEFIPDPLLLQIMLTEHFKFSLERHDVAHYEKFRDVVDTYIKEPFLKEPLHQKYLQAKQRVKNPQVYTEALLKEAANLSVNQVVDEIFQQNKGKVIYVDFWGTWCGPCLAEMPNSKNVEHELRNEDVAFVYICLESEEKQWKAVIDKFQLGGQHYFLSRQQSGDMRKLFEIIGVPFYMLIDKNGVIKEKHHTLSPMFAKDKIIEMLK